METDRKRRRGRTSIKAGAVAGAMLSFAPACGSVAPHIYVVDCEQPTNGACTCSDYTLNSQGDCVLSTSNGSSGTSSSGGSGTTGGSSGSTGGGGKGDGGGDAG